MGTNRFASGANRYWVAAGIGLLWGGIPDLLRRAAALALLLGGIEELLELLRLL